MKIVIIDGQGGGLGRALIEAIHLENETLEIIAVGTNAIATAAMLKAGANAAATGENAIVYNCAKANLIIGAIGIAFANSMYGEISPAMAAAVSSSEAVKLLIPNAKCSAFVVGVNDKPLALYIAEVVARVKEMTASICTRP